MKFIMEQIGIFNKLNMLGKFSRLPHGFELLEGNIRDQDEPRSGEFACQEYKGSHSFKFPH